VTPHLQLCGQESAPQHRSHIRICVPYNAHPPLNLQHGKWLHHVGGFLFTQLPV
jgi:hypothetical protein